MQPSFHYNRIQEECLCRYNNFNNVIVVTPNGRMWYRCITYNLLPILVLCVNQAVLETVARVKPKKNDTKGKEDKYYLLLWLGNPILEICNDYFEIMYIDWCELLTYLLCYFRSFQLHNLFKNDNAQEDTATLIDRKVKLLKWESVSTCIMTASVDESSPFAG